MAPDAQAPQNRGLSRRGFFQLGGALGVGALTMWEVGPFSPDRASAAGEIVPSCGRVVFRDRFNEGTSANWSTPSFVEGHGSVQFVPDPADGVATVAKFTVPNDGVSFRAEMGQRQFTFGRYRYAISHWIPSDWKPYPYETIIAQWHGFNINGQNLNPPIALSVHGLNPKWMVRVFHLESTNPVVVAPTVYLPAAPILYDQWNHWTFDITWSTPTSDGLLVIGHNGSEVLRAPGVNNYHQQNSPHFQTGIYRSTWRPGNTEPVGRPDVVVYTKGVSITDLRGCTAPAPTGADVAAESEDGAAITLMPLAADMGIGRESSVDPASLRLVDSSGADVTRLAVPGEGVWSLGPTTGSVVFTPDAMLEGAATPVRYRAEFLTSDARTETLSAFLRARVVRPPLALVALPPVTTTGTLPVSLRPTDGARSGGSTIAEPATLRLIDPGTRAAATRVALPGTGTFTVAGDGTVTFAPAAGFEGTTTLDVQVDDQFGRTSGTTLAVTVRENPAAAPRPAIATTRGAAPRRSPDGVLASTGNDITPQATIGAAAIAAGLGLRLIRRSTRER